MEKRCFYFRKNGRQENHPENVDYADETVLLAEM